MKIRSRSDLREGQLDMIREMDLKEGRLIVAGMGGGKTGAGATYMVDTLNEFRFRHWLVVAPYYVATETWPTELEVWEHTRFVDYQVINGTPEQRAEQVDRKAEITIINFELLQWLGKHLGSTDNWYWDAVLIDEISLFRSGQQKTQKTVTIDPKTGKRKVRQGGKTTRFGVMVIASPKIDRVIGLSGTPRPKSVENMWGVVYLLDMGRRLGRNISAFRQRYFRWSKIRQEHIPRRGASEQIANAVADLVYVHPDQGLVDEPEIIDLPVTLPKKVMTQYKVFEKEMLDEARGVSAPNRAVLSGKLLQYANGIVYRDGHLLEETVEKVSFVHDEKLKALDALVAGEQNMLVMYSFKPDRDRILKRYKEAVDFKADPDAIKKWNRGEISMLVAHPGSMGHGTNLQFGGHIMVWFGMPTNPEQYQQANWRLPRPGQEHPVKIYRILARGTRDYIAIRTVEDANMDEQEFLDLIVDINSGRSRETDTCNSWML